MNLLQDYFFIPLDIFHNYHQNKIITTKLDAWLTFLTSDEPETIISLINAFPQFQPMYQELYDICSNVEGVMYMFSKELQELDRNTVQYMIDIMQDEIDQQKLELAQKEEELTQKDALHQLTAALLKDNRVADLQRSLTDTEFQTSLLKEYNLLT